MRPSPNFYWLAGVVVALVIANAGSARADLIDEATTACRTKSIVAQMGRLIDNNDMRSLRKLVDSKTKIGDCKPIRAHTEVKIDRRDSDLACVEAKGDTKCSWVLETKLRITSERRQPVHQDYIACKSQLYLETGRKILAEQDQDAIRRFRIATNQSGQCLALKKGEQVDVERRDDKILCVRPPGEDQCYWTDNSVLPANLAEQASERDGKTLARHKNPRKPK
jgi:hypothetical protein